MVLLFKALTLFKTRRQFVKTTQTHYWAFNLLTTTLSSLVSHKILPPHSGLLASKERNSLEKRTRPFNAMKSADFQETNGRYVVPTTTICIMLKVDPSKGWRNASGSFEGNDGTVRSLPTLRLIKLLPSVSRNWELLVAKWNMFGIIILSHMGGIWFARFDWFDRDFGLSTVYGWTR